MVYSFGGSSIHGNKNCNQDCACYYLAEYEKEHIVLLAVCDGMGGLEHGEIASSIVLSAFETWFQHQIPLLANRSDRMEQVRIQWHELLLYQNRNLFALSQARNIQMGTALAALLLWEDVYLSVNVGDVRGYLLRNHLEQITVDQSYVAAEIAAGHITPDEARVHPDRHILLHCIGLGKPLEAVFSSGKIQNGDLFLLCSDGFTGKLWEAEIEALLSGRQLTVLGGGLQDRIDELIGRARQRGEQDDITAAAVWLNGEPYHKEFPKDAGWLDKLMRKKQLQPAPIQPLQLRETIHLGAVRTLLP